MLFVILLLKNQKTKNFAKSFLIPRKNEQIYYTTLFFIYNILVYKCFWYCFYHKSHVRHFTYHKCNIRIKHVHSIHYGHLDHHNKHIVCSIGIIFMTRKDLKSDLRMYLFQIPISCCFGLFIDFSMYILSWLNPSNYLYQIAVLILGCIILAAGISLEVKANAAMMSGEYFVNVITRRFHKEFGYVKLGFDITLLVIACVLSLIFMDGIHGVREGTITAAILVGPIVHFISPYYSIFDKWIINPEIRENKSLKTTITLSSQ